RKAAAPLRAIAQGRSAGHGLGHRRTAAVVRADRAAVVLGAQLGHARFRPQRPGQALGGEAGHGQGGRAATEFIEDGKTMKLIRSGLAAALTAVALLAGGASAQAPTPANAAAL